MFEHTTTAERIQAAKEKTERVVDHLLYLLALHENNAIIVYSDTLSSQIRYLHAANAFNVFQAGLHQFEIVRLCALWDRAEETKENIPTIAELIDHPGVMDALAEETRSHWVNNTGSILNPSNDLQLRKAEEEELKRIDERFGQEQADKARAELTRAISKTREMLASQRLTSIMNLRDKHLAHSLSETRRERKTGRVLPMKYGDEREVLSCSLAIVEAFSLDHLIRLTFFVKGPFPNGGVLSSPNFRQDVLDEFFAQHCSKHCSYNNPPPSEVIGVAALAHPDLVIEIVAVAAVPD